MMKTCTLPILTADSCAHDIQAACQKWGAFYYPLDQSFQDNILASGQAFFDLPMEIKASIPAGSGGFKRGYIGYGGESGSNAFEAKEGFSFGYPWPANTTPRHPLQGPNVWPQTQGSFKETQLSFFTEMVRVSLEIMDLLSVSLGKDRPYLRQFCEKGDTISLCRLFHYLSIKDVKSLSVQHKEHQEITGSSAHTDWGFITLIVSELGKPGLQVKSPDGDWMTVLPKPGYLFVNLGDYLSLLTQGAYVSPLHRVLLNEQDPRLSYVFFFYPDYDSKIPPLLTTQSLSLLTNQESETLKSDLVPPDTFGQWLFSKWSQVERHGYQ